VRTCTAGVESAVPACDGGGRCGPGQTRPCAPYVCSGDACGASCTLDGDCSKGNYCLDKICTARRPNGTMCRAGAECLSNNCAEGVCCLTACPAGFYCPGGTCMPKRTNASVCASAVECQSGFCTDGRCCEVACTDACYRCNATGAFGRCSLIPDGQTDENPACRVCNGAGGCRTP
jgi:hypothetical protein